MPSVVQGQGIARGEGGGGGGGAEGRPKEPNGEDNWTNEGVKGKTAIRKSGFYI